MKNKKTISIFIPHVGCPNDCVFCNQVKITGRSTTVTAEEIKSIIETQKTTIKENSLVEVAFFGGSFTAIEQEIQEEFLSVVYEYIERGEVDYIRVSTRPDKINDEILKRLKKYGVKIIELGVQSLDEEVLKASERGHDTQSVYRSSELIKSYGFELGLQMMVGLPSDTQEKAIETAIKIADMGPTFVRIYPVIVLEGTKLEEMYKRGIYTPISLDETISTVGKLIKIFKNNKITIIRIGLQNSEEIRMDGSAIAGPFHPALGEVCYSRYYRNMIEELLLDMSEKPKEIKLNCPNSLVSKFVGNKRGNSEFFREKGILFKVNAWDKETVLVKCDKEEFYIEI